jgi:lipoyl(octanoyl) transferase
MNACLIVDLGLIAYAEAWELQERVVAARKAGAIEDVLLFCEHPHVITLGRSGKRANLLASESVLRQKGIEFFESSRGGDITYHGPGQIVGYPIVNLGAIRRDVVWYVRTLEEAMIRATADLGIAARREPGKTGIWVDAREVAGRSKRDSSLALKMTDQQAEKLAAIGVHISRWVTSHGFAYNVATDLRYFELIVPCGIADRKATSLEKLLGRRVSLEEIRPLLVKQLCEVFGLTVRTEEPAGLFAKLAAFEQALSVSA